MKLFKFIIKKCRKIINFYIKLIKKAIKKKNMPLGNSDNRESFQDYLNKKKALKKGRLREAVEETNAEVPQTEGDGIPIDPAPQYLHHTGNVFINAWLGLDNTAAINDVPDNEAERQRIIAEHLERQQELLDQRAIRGVDLVGRVEGYSPRKMVKSRYSEVVDFSDKKSSSPKKSSSVVTDMDQLKGFLFSIMEQKEIVLGKSLSHKLKRMGDTISRFLLDLHNSSEVLSIDFSYIDTATEEGFISYLPIKKKDIGNERDVWRHPSRQKTKIGRLVTAVANERGVQFTQPEIDSFVAKYRSIQKVDDSEQLEFADWKMTKGDDIIKWYNGNSYHHPIDGGDTLNKSCMRYDKCGDYLHVYTHTPFISLLTLISKENGLLMGRALIWNDILIDGEKATFMDRIYCVEGPLDELFKAYAEKRGWWYKATQNAKPYTPITNGAVVKQSILQAYIINDINWSDWKKNRVPYLDTLKFFKYFKDVETGKLVPRLTNDENQKWDDNWSYNHGGFCEECDGKGKHTDHGDTMTCEYCKGVGRR